MARKQYFVSPSGSQWRVTHQGRALSSHITKPPAVEAGRTAAIANQPSQLIVQRADGTVEDERTYGQDPYPPRG